MPVASTLNFRHYALDKGSFASEPPLGWTLPLPTELLPFCDGDANRRSTLALLESGRELGPPHALHDEVRQAGSGRFSFWKGTLYFSTSDGSDPNTNRHTYIARNTGADPASARFAWLVPPPADPGLTEDQRLAVRLAEEAARRRLRQFGDAALGENNYIRLRLDAGLVVTEHEAAAVAFLRQHRGRWRRIWDIGAGLGQMSLLLALDGFDVVAVEADAGTRAGLEAVFAAVAESFPEIRNRLTIAGGYFPEVADGHDLGGDAAVVMCCTFTESEQYYDRFLHALSRFDAGMLEWPQ